MTLLFWSALPACQKLAYLKSPAFKKERQERVAQMVQFCDTIIEIGGGQTPMSGFLPKDKKVIVIDPHIKRKEEQNVTHLSMGFEKWNEQPTSTNFAVVILGLHLQMPDGAWKKLHDLIDRSSITIIEYSALDKCAKKQFKDIKNSCVSKQWAEPEEFEINAQELAKFKGSLWNHRVLQHTLAALKEHEGEIA